MDNHLDQAFSNFLNKKDSSWMPEIIVIGPGGIKSYLELGAMLKLESEGLFKSVSHWIGCSAGSAIALLLAAGCSVSEIIENTLKINMFQDITDIDSFQELMEKRGILSNNAIELSLRSKMIDKFGKDPTFEQLYMATGIELTITTYNLTKERPEYLNYITEPNLSCVTATMMSMVIPIIMQRKIYKDNEYIDGAFGNPYPIDIVDNGEREILGLYVGVEKYEITNPINFIQRIAQSSINQLRTRIIKNSSNKCKHLECKTSVKDEIAISNKAKIKLVREGYEKATKFISQIKNPEQYKLLLNENEEIPFDINLQKDNL